MDDISIFTDKSHIPYETDLIEKLTDSYALWKQLYDFVFKKYPDGRAEWNYPGKKYGWSFGIKDKKRAIIYLLPRDKYFKVAFIFGDKAINAIIQSNISDSIKNELMQARKYA